MKLFISHASPDKPIVRRICERLKGAGLDVWLDESDIQTGHSIPARIAEGLADCEILLLAFSKRALTSAWVGRELNSFFMQAINLGKPILPCKLDDATPPTLLADIKYADFSASFEHGMTSLLSGVGVLEEVELTNRSATIRDALTEELNEATRRRCYNTFVAGPGVKLNMFALPEGEVKRLLLRLQHLGLIEDVPDGDDGSLVATPLGIRVFAPWNEDLASVDPRRQ